MKQKSFYKLIAILYFILPYCVLFFASKFLNITEFPDSIAVAMDWILEHSATFTLYSVLELIIPTILVFVYIVPIFFGKPNCKTRIINAPLALGLLSMLYLFLSAAAIVDSAVTFYLESNIKSSELIVLVLAIDSLAAFLAFSMTYLISETLNRTFILKRVFPDGVIPAGKGIFKPSLLVTYIAYFIGFVFLPIAILFYYHYLYSTRYGYALESFVYLPMVFFVVTGFVIIILLANLSRRPLKKFSAAAKRISEGNYKDKVEVFSADEFGALSSTFNEMQKSLVEKDFMRDTFGKIVSPEIRDYILNNKVSLGGETKVVTVMFCDIRNFTSLSEKLKSEEVVQMLNIYFTVMEKCIAKHNGIINKYIGDAIMAIFGTPIENPHHALDAYLAGNEMRKKLVDVNKKFAELGFPQIKNGIGLHTGTALAGNIGAENRMEFTVIGDTVNAASRIEGLCKEYEKDFLISETTAIEIEKAIQEKKSENKNLVGIVQLQFLCESAIRGKEEKIGLYWA